MGILFHESHDGHMTVTCITASTMERKLHAIKQNLRFSLALVSPTRGSGERTHTRGPGRGLTQVYSLLVFTHV